MPHIRQDCVSRNPKKNLRPKATNGRGDLEAATRSGHREAKARAGNTPREQRAERRFAFANDERRSISPAERFRKLDATPERSLVDTESQQKQHERSRAPPENPGFTQTSHPIGLPIRMPDDARHARPLPRIRLPKPYPKAGGGDLTQLVYLGP